MYDTIGTMSPRIQCYDWNLRWFAVRISGISRVLEFNVAMEARMQSKGGKARLILQSD